MKNMEINRRVNRIKQIRRIIKNTGSCLICIRRQKGQVKKYLTKC